MKARHHRAVALVVLLASGLAGTAASAPAARPNIVFILADDLGYGDLACYGRKDVRTPAIDSLARDGVRLTRCYANAAECTPTRAAFLTGRYQQRVGGLECAIGVGHVGRYDDAIRLCAQGELGLPATEASLARLLKAAGYDTGLSGKWHLGYDPKFSPVRHGFAHAFYVQGGEAEYFFHTEPNGEPTLYLNEQPVKRDGYMTDLITDDAVQFIARKRAAPFFLYVAYTAPHAPYQGPGDAHGQPLPPDSARWNQSKGPRETYVAMVERLDDGVGRILHALDTAGLSADTVVVFTSDNGATRSGSCGALRGFKGSTFEGGIRVPALVRWPGRLKAGTVSEQVGVTMDFTASFAALAGDAPQPAPAFDGVDILRLLREGREPVSRTLFWRMRRGARTKWAALDGSLKLVREKEGEREEASLFDLAGDPLEQQDLSHSRAGELQALSAKLAAWEREVRPAR